VADHRGWLLDLYEDERDGLVLWFAADSGERLRLTQPFPVTFYAAGPVERLRELWRYLRSRYEHLSLGRTRKRDLFSGMLDVMSIQVANPAVQMRLFFQAKMRFPDIDYFDADIPITVRYSAVYGVFPLSRCRIETDDDGVLLDVTPLESRWDLNPSQPPLRVLAIEPDVNPFHSNPTYLTVRSDRESVRIDMRPRRYLLQILQARLKRIDPDVLMTNWGDTWLLPFLLDAANEIEGAMFNPNRDQNREVGRRKERSYFTYGQVIFRGGQVHLYGRWHIDQWNAMMYGHYGLEGVLEQARVTGLPVQEVARKSPGAGITAMQMYVALQEGILVPYHKQQSERFKSASDLIRSDRGGMVYQPLVGMHKDVAEIDFVSMYPSIMVHFNISPESVGTHGLDSATVPEIGIPVDQSEEGLVPKTLRPLLAKRIAIKQRLATMDRRDCRYGPLKARSDALKWLLVVCFGYLGYKNARFGRIESHESVTAYGRESLLRAKEAAEDMGFTVLHMYVDGLWVKRPGIASEGDLKPLLDEIAARTGLPIALEGIYRWIAFLPSRIDHRVPVANRYFGVFQDGMLKVRGIDVRRHDTAPFVAQAQLAALAKMARVPSGRSLDECLPEVMRGLQRSLASLRARQVPLDQLVVAQNLSRSLDEYRVPSPAARAATQLLAVGKEMRPGQRVKFIFTLGEPGVWAWDLPQQPSPASVDTGRYTELLARAAVAVLEPLGIGEPVVRDWLTADVYQEPLDFGASLRPHGAYALH
jgi:DNA polymerase-2